MTFPAGASSPTTYQNPWTGNTEGQSAWTTQVQIAESAANNTLLEGGSREISRSHWQSLDNCNFCGNRSCKKKFSLLERAHHCRRCGRVFCNACLQYKRKLNLVANPDPYGKSYKVCRHCFEEGQDCQGQIRRLTEQFSRLRRQCKQELAITQNGLTTKSWRNRFNLDAECKRLTDGFMSYIGTSEVKKTLHELTTIISIPEWQKSATWLEENMADTCQTCFTKFGLTKKKVNCKVCGCVTCKQCSSKDLLLYIPNDQVKMKQAEPRLSIIKIIGCPEKEPEIAMYLRVCKQCQEKLTQKQINTAAESIETDSNDDNITVLVNMDKSCRQIRQKLDVQITEYQNVIESLHDNSTQEKDAGRSNIKTLAKAQVDIADFLSQFVEKIQSLKRMKPETNTQALVFRNCLKSKCDYYFDSTYTFRQLKRKLDDSAPETTLRVIQRTVNKNAIVSMQVYLRQLVYESIHICDKHNIGDNIPQILSSLDGVVEQEAEECLISEGEDWDEHQTIVTEMVKQQMKKHQLVRLSRRLLRNEGTKHAMTMINRRSVDILSQIQVQLEMKSTNRSFKNTKKVLESTYHQLKSIKNET